MKKKTTTKTKRTKNPKMKTGRSIPGILCAAFLLLMAAPGSLPAAKKDKGKKVEGAAASAILAGTVFTGVGFALRGAAVSVTALPPESTSEQPAKPKKPARREGFSDARGEFLLRLPAGPARYNVVVRANGHQPQEKQLIFAADERQDQNFLLEPAREAAGK